MNGYQELDAAQAAIVNARMGEALGLAAEAIGLSDPNPRVGCVLTDARDRVIGRGHTQQAGGPHAEVMALREARAHGEPLAGATAYVTLEPCSHFGRTPPCCDALIEAGVARVVVALRDPNPLVAGAGSARLRAAGIEVIELPEDGPHALAARRLNVGFLFRMQHGRPWVRLLVVENDDSSWHASDEARRDLDVWRRRAGALLADGVASRMSCEGAASGTSERGGAEPRRLVDAQGGVDLRAVVDELGREGINELQVEAGGALADALFEAQRVDEVLAYVPHDGESGEAEDRLWAATGSNERGNYVLQDSVRLGPILRLVATRRAS